jgi:hypothetical protein
MCLINSNDFWTFKRRKDLATAPTGWPYSAEANGLVWGSPLGVVSPLLVTDWGAPSPREISERRRGVIARRI